MLSHAEPSPFSVAGPRLVENGYSAIPLVPGDKIPGVLQGHEWKFRRGWTKFCETAPTAFDLRLWQSWPNAGLGVACGRGLIAVDIDRDDLVKPVLAVLPAVTVAKKGQKGLTCFFRGNTDLIRSRSFKIDGFTVLDLIAHGKQTVLPPSIHPRTGAPYTWTTARNLADTPLNQLPEVPANLVERIAGALTPFGYAEEKAFEFSGEVVEANSQATDFYRRLNETALANLDAWVPRLGLQRAIRQPNGWRAVPEWRPSNSGKPLGRRSLNLSFNRNGIVDFGDGEKTYTAINAVMAAHDLGEWQFNQAVVWLGEALGYDFSPDPAIENLVERAFSKPVGETEPDTDSEPEFIPESAKKSVDPRVQRMERLHELTHVPGLVGDLVNWIEASAPNPNRILAFSAALSLVGALAGRMYASPTDLRTNLYSVGLAPSGFGKDHARDCIKNLLTKAGLMRYLGGSKIMSGSAMRARVEQQPSILWMIDEFGGFVRMISDKRSQHTFQIRDYMLEYFTSAATSFQGADYAGSNGTLCYNPNVCLYGTSTPVDFWGACSSLAVADGFLARFLVFHVDGELPDDVRPSQSKSNPPEQLIKSCQQLLTRRAGMGNLAGVTSDGSTAVEPYAVQWAGDGEDEWLGLRSHYRKISHRASAELQPIWNRAAEHAQKLALILSIGIDPAAPMISAETLQTAAEVVDLCIAGTIDEISGRIADNDRQREYLLIKRLIIEAGPEGISRTVISRRINGLIDRKRLDDILETLTLVAKEVATTFSQNPNGGPRGARYTSVKYLSDNEES